MQDQSLSAFENGFSASGHPVHTRSLEVEIEQAEDGRIRAGGRILDLRKHGFVPTGGDLQMSGFIHNMMLDAWVDPETRVLEILEPTQPVVAFEASAHTGGESCRDIAHHLRDLAGERLDDGFAKKLSGVFGGPLGCSHLLTLAQLLASTLRAVLDLEAVVARHHVRDPGERIFKRSLVLDGLEQDDGARMAITVQQNDVHTTPFSQVTSPLDRFRHQHEVRVLAHVDMQTMTFVDITGDERTRDRVGLAGMSWQSRAEVLSPLVGQPALHGLGRSLLERFGGDSARPELLDAMLNLAPGLIQCMAAMAHRIVENRQKGAPDTPGGPSILQLGGLPDSCYLWRAGGPAQRQRGGGDSLGDSDDAGDEVA
jgi:hypothetical protein